MNISIASGKGGTGKTTIAVNLAYSLASQKDINIQILDCDVDAPNAHLFLKPEITQTHPVSAGIPLIDETKCNYCRKCMEICRFNAIAVMGKKKILSFPELCHSCGGCMEICPEKAITEHPRTLGMIESGHAHGMEFYQGLLEIGQVMSPPIIKKIRGFANEKSLTIIDAPPGTSCPVIAAMNNTDFVILVTEPTPFGLHDLSLAAQAVKILGIPCGIVINRSTIGDDSVMKYAKETNIPVLMEIPFEKKIAEIYSKGGLIAEAMPEYKARFIELFEQIKAVSQTKAGAA